MGHRNSEELHTERKQNVKSIYYMYSDNIADVIKFIHITFFLINRLSRAGVLRSIQHC